VLKTTRKISGSALRQLPQKCYINNVAIIIIAFQKEIFNASRKLKINFEITACLTLGRYIPQSRRIFSRGAI
jgi:hypothetical protein